jgi:SagB-type dehydrogenase family enzyme
MLDDPPSFLRLTELDRSNSAELTERIAQAEGQPTHFEPRSYPGYPRFPLPVASRRLWPPLDRVLASRRSIHRLDSRLPSAARLGRLLRFSHGVNASQGRGPIPSAGGLLATELYLVHWQAGWLPPGVYHFDRRDASLAQIDPIASIDAWIERVPSLQDIDGGAILWLIVGDSARVISKYGFRGERFLLLEAGHLMQNLCLVSASLKLCTVPLGGVSNPKSPGS